MVTCYWSADTCFDRCQLIITWMSNIREVHSKSRLHARLCQVIIWIIAVILRDSVITVVRTRPRAIPLAMITMRKSTHGFPFASHTGMGLRLAALRYYEFRQKFNFGMVSNFRSFLSALSSALSLKAVHSTAGPKLIFPHFLSVKRVWHIMNLDKNLISAWFQIFAVFYLPY